MLCGLRAAPPASRSRVANPTRRSVLSGLCCPFTHFYFLASSFSLWLMQVPEQPPGYPCPCPSLGCACSSAATDCQLQWPQQQASTGGCVSTAGVQLLWTFTYQTLFQHRAGEDLERSLSPSPALRRIADSQPLPDRCLSCLFLKTFDDRDL